ncbi:helix-turn-helix domain-containing protein [Patescibacteria group bacterium]|nr:helix-turn-helix domain-containing protein [Patescibacteria group bacterium]
MENKTNKTHISVSDFAKILGISRTAVLKKITKGQVPAERIGRSYAIPMGYVSNMLNDGKYKELTQKEKEEIEKMVEKIVDEYGDTLRLLGKE